MTGIKVGDLVRVKEGSRLEPHDPLAMPPSAGIVIDLIEDDVGYSHAYGSSQTCSKLLKISV
mgnify:CR=1 FL=1